MKKHLTLGVGIGTSAVKTSLFDTETNKVIAEGRAEHPLLLPEPGYAEQTGDSYWVAVVEAVRQCLDGTDYAEHVAAVGLSGLVGSALPVGQDGVPVRPGLIWMDARASEECEELRAAVGEEAINYNNGNRIACWFVEPKALWIKKHEPENFYKTYKFLSATGYCAYKMSGVMSINRSDAGLFYPYDYQKGVWNAELAEKIGIPIEKYPKIYDCDEVIGVVTREAAEATGLKEGTLVVAGGSDISSAALGCGVYQAGQAYYSMGTGSNLGIMIPTPERKEEYRILKWPAVNPGLTLFDAPMAYTGASLNWFRNQFGCTENLIAGQVGEDVFDLLTRTARDTRPGANGLMYLPYMGNSLAPNWNPSAKGIFFGATIGSTKGDWVRALLEGVAYDLYSNVEIALASGAAIDVMTVNGGPTKSRFWNQITADVTGISLELTNIGEAEPLGDCILAARGAGIYSSLTEPVKDIVRIVGKVEPDMENHKMYMEFFQIWKRIYKKLLEEMEDHHQLVSKYMTER